MIKKIIGSIALALSLAVSATPKDVEGYEISISQILPIGYQLAQERKEGSHTVFIFEENGQLESANQLNIQFSIENSKFGVDWVLKAPRNIAEKDVFVAFAKSKGYSVQERNMNGVPYIRIEDGGSLFTLVKLVITELYSVQEDMPIGLIFSGIKFN